MAINHQRHFLLARQSSVFCHVARLLAPTQAHLALKLQVDLSPNRYHSAVWERHLGRPHGWLVDDLCQDNHSPVDLWSSAIRRGHSEATLRSSLTTY